MAKPFKTISSGAHSQVRKEILILIFASSCIFLGSCITFKIKPLPPPEDQVEYVLLCKEVDESGDLISPIAIQSEYTSQDSHIICLIRIKNVSKEIHLMWKWYAPEKKMAKDTGNVVINHEEKYLELVTAYDIFEFNPKENIEGQWRVVVFLNNKLIGRKAFQIKPEKKN